jgi:hypothetical protein
MLPLARAAPSADAQISRGALISDILPVRGGTRNAMRVHFVNDARASDAAQQGDGKEPGTFCVQK